MTAAAVAPPSNIIRWHYLWYVALALAVMVAAILSGSRFFLNFVHVFSGILWTGIDLFLGFVLGPILRKVDFHTRREIAIRLTPRTLFLMPTLAVLTGTTGWYLVVMLGFNGLPWPEYGWVAAALALGSIGGVFLLMRSSFGLGLMSVRDNDLAAMSVGVDVRRNRFIVFVLSAAGCGLAGAVSFLGNLYISPPGAFDVNWVVYMMFIVMIGGIGTLEGPIIGTVIFFGLREVITDQLGFSAGLYLVALGTVAVIVMLWSPLGLWPPLRDRFGFRLLGVGRTAPGTARLVPLAEKAAE